MTSLMTPTRATDEEFDPVSLEIMWSRLISIADEMWTTVLRTAVSTIIGAAQDFGCELLDERGNSLAHSYRSCRSSTWSCPKSTRRMIEIFPVERCVRGTCSPPTIRGCAPGTSTTSRSSRRSSATVVWLPSPTRSRTPRRSAARWTGCACAICTRKDFFIPPLRLYDQGRPNETAFAFIRSNVRQPEMVLTDIESQVTANEAAAARAGLHGRVPARYAREPCARRPVARRSRDAQRN